MILIFYLFSKFNLRIKFWELFYHDLRRQFVELIIFSLTINWYIINDGIFAKKDIFFNFGIS